MFFVLVVFVFFLFNNEKASTQPNTNPAPNPKPNSTLRLDSSAPSRRVWENLEIVKGANHLITRNIFGPLAGVHVLCAKNTVKSTVAQGKNRRSKALASCAGSQE